MGAAVAALSASFAACGGDSSDTQPSEAKGAYPVEIFKEEFPKVQRLGQTSLLRLGFRNAGEERMPAMTVTMTIVGNKGETSGLPFAIRDPQPGLSQPDRPVWVLSEHYPRLAGSNESAGAETGNGRTYELGPQGPGEMVEAIWKLSAVKTGIYQLRYEIGAGLGGKSRAETTYGGKAGGRLTVKITDEPPETEVTDNGEVVEIDAQGNDGS